jgi:hypothetical protein
MQTNYIQAIVNWNNIGTIPAAVASALVLMLTGNPNQESYEPPPIAQTTCIACSVTTLVQATPTVTGVNQINLQLQSEPGTTDEILIELVTNAINLLNLGNSLYYQTWPTMGVVTIVSVEVTL